MAIGHVQLREKFKSFWKTNNHAEVPPIPLVPQNDPTTLFTGSGMQQFVPNLLGEPHPQGKQLYNIQPCLRAQDIEEVGDNRHDTFFEMIGNWSLGTYFKKEQLAWFWKFLTEELQLPKDKLYVSVFEGTKNLPEDSDSYSIWKSLGISEKKIFKYGPDKNWWSRAGIPKNMPAGEPGGPDSEVFYEFTNVVHDPKFGKKCHPNCDCGRFMEIGNSVFMQYKKISDGTFQELKQKNVDFGGGLERLLAAAYDNPDIFVTDLYANIISEIEIISNKQYSDPLTKSAFRIIADHLKTSVFLIKDGIVPSNKAQGYVLRRLLRRAALKLYQLGLRSEQIVSFKNLCQSILKTYMSVYFQTFDELPLIESIIQEEMSKFSKSIIKGMNEIEKIKVVDGKAAFDLYQNYGFPLEITEEILKEQGKTVDKEQFRKEFEKHKALSRSSSTGMFKGGLADHSEQVLKYHTATHLIHQALFDVLGDDIRQEGSNITGERLRFDFSSSKKPSPEKMIQVSEIVNQKIKESLLVNFKIIPKEEALKIGAKSFFREKYPDMVKVYFIGGSTGSPQDAYSKELCGGPHVTNTKEIQKIDIYKFEKIGSNLYRIYAR